jgi:hypothetical protein
MNPAIVLVRTMQCAFIVSVLLFILVLHIVHPAPHSVSAPLQWSIGSCAIASGLMGFIVQGIWSRAPIPAFPLAQDAILRSRWLAGHVLRFATAESVALFGFVLRMMGSTSILVTVLFASALVLLLIWQPGVAPTQTAPQSSVG